MYFVIFNIKTVNHFWKRCQVKEAFTYFSLPYLFLIFCIFCFYKAKVRQYTEVHIDLKHRDISVTHCLLHTAIPKKEVGIRENFEYRCV